MALFRVSKAGAGSSLTPEVIAEGGNSYTFTKNYSKVLISINASLGLTGMNYSGAGTVIDQGSASGGGSGRYMEIDNVSSGDTVTATASGAFAGWVIGWGFE